MQVKALTKAADQNKFRLAIAVIVFFLMLLFGCSEKKKYSGYPDCNSSDIEWNDSCLLHLPLKNALQKLNLDTSGFETFGDSSGVLSGIGSDTDSCHIELYVRNTVVADSLDPMNYELILDSPVIGLSWSKPLKEKERVLYP
ncbi:MAG TPA: hypothetical protein VNR87_00170 [Flavisolibacter sp.]|nr:hypothetical protein [Flavisolibacter sp.]